jgi:hypothetical protein
MSFSKIICEALPVPPPGEKDIPIEWRGRCGICGGEDGPFYNGQSLTGNSTAMFLEHFHGGDCPVCQYCASLYRAQNAIAGNNIGSKAMAVVDGVGYLPMIARDSAVKEGRACWSDLVRSARYGAECVFILSTDTKKRVWPGAKSGVIGSNTPVLLYDGELALTGCVFVDWREMLSSLNLVEDVYSCGFTKRQIFTSLFSDIEKFEMSPDDVLALEDALKSARESRGSAFIQLISQKKDGDLNNENARRLKEKIDLYTPNKRVRTASDRTKRDKSPRSGSTE